MNQDETVVRIQNLRKSFGSGDSQVDALRGVNLDIARGEFLAVMGPSGSGKSTLLHLIGGLDSPNAGTITVDDQDLSTLNDRNLTLLRREKFGFVFQAFNLLDVLTAEENVALPLIIAGVPEGKAHQRAVEALQVVDLADRLSHQPPQLSGGQQQRLAIARALVAEPLVLLADEPTGNLDSSTSDQIMRVLRSLCDEHKQTILMVTHNKRHAAMADRMLEMRDGVIGSEYTVQDPAVVTDIVRDLEPH